MRNNKKLTVFMVLFVAAAVVFCMKITKGNSEKTLTVTDCYGITYLAVIDQNQQVYAGITDKEGNLYGARIDENGEVVLDAEVYPVGEYTGTLPYNDTTVVNIQQTNDDSYDYGAEVSRVDKTTTATDKNNKPDDDKNTSTTKPSTPETLRTEKYRKLFGSGTYVMVFTTDDPEIPDAVTAAFKNGNVCVDTKVEDMDCQVIYREDLQAGWIVIPSIRTYCELPQDMALEMSDVKIMSDDDFNYESVETYNVMIGSKDCYCEDFTYSDGSRKCYYYDGDTLVRMDIVDKDGNADIYSFSKISSTVDDSYFEKPRGYMKIDLSFLSMEDLETTE